MFLTLDHVWDKLILTYEDNGPGIKENYRKKVFEIFETLESKSSNSVGIGLATLKSVIDRLNGAVELKDRPDNKEGVCFEIVLPYILQ